MKFRFGSNSRFQVTPPGELWPRATQFNEKERSANARPDDDQIAPSVIGEQLERVYGSKNQRDPFGHDPEKQFDPGIDGGESNKNSKV